MNIAYIAEKEELQALIKDSIHEEIEAFLKGLNHKTIPERMSLSETALYLGVSKQTMYGYTSSRKIPFHKFGKRIFFYTRELDDWLKSNAPRYKSRDEIAREADQYLMNASRKKLNRR